MGTEEVLCWEVYVESIMFSELREEGKGGGGGMHDSSILVTLYCWNHSSPLQELTLINSLDKRVVTLVTISPREIRQIYSQTFVTSRVGRLLVYIVCSYCVCHKCVMGVR